MRRRCFTLLELLVVIGIIAILASMLLPALGSARRKALEVECVNRKHQLSMSIGMYMDDHSGYIPGPMLSLAKDSVIYPVLLRMGYLDTGGALERLSHCPHTEHTDGCNPHNNGVEGPSVGVNGNFHLSGHVDSVRHPYRLMNVPSPASVSYLSDTRGWADSGCEDGKVGFSYQSDGRHFGFYHGLPKVVYSTGKKIERLEGDGRMSVAFVDFHVEVLSRQQVLGFGEGDSFYHPGKQE